MKAGWYRAAGLHTAARWYSTARWGLPALVCALACSKNAPTNVECRQGATSVCTGAQGCDGQRVCEGGQWSECDCGDTAGEAPTVGNACNRDSDCAGGEICLEGQGETFLGGVPVVGTCVIPCSGDASRCDSLSRPSVCVVTDDRGTPAASDDVAHCFERCDLSAAPTNKCQNREHVACHRLRSSGVASAAPPPMSALGDVGDSNIAFCRPLCAADAECLRGLFCDVATGACGEAPAVGDGLGVPCDPEASPTTCAGACLTVDGLSFCSHRCKFGAAGNCGAPLVDTEDAEMVSAATDAGGDPAGNPGLCRFPEDHGGVADTAFCTELCNCDEECTHPDAVCDGFDDAELEALTSRLGVCVSPVDPAGDARSGLPCE